MTHRDQVDHAAAPVKATRSVRSRRRRGEQRRLSLEPLEARVVLSANNLNVVGKVFVDNNGDGAFDRGDTPQTNWVVWVDSNGNNRREAGEPFDRTDANGDYHLCLPNTGTHFVRRAYTSAYQAITPEGTFVTRTGPGTSYVDFVMGEFSGTPVRGTVYDDVNQNGYYNPATDPGLPNRVVWLDLDNDRKRDPGEPFDRTNPAGQYELFADPGVYTLRVAGLPSGTEPFYVAWNYLDETGAQGVEFEVRDGDDTVFYDFAQINTIPGTSVVKGWIRIDLDNGNDHSGLNRYERGIENRVVWVDLDNDRRRDADEPFDRTDPQGRYRIVGLETGSRHFVRIAGSGDWQNTTPGAVLTDFVETETVVSFGQISPSLDLPTADVSGRVWHDRDSSRGRGIGEPGLADWVVYVDTNANGRREAGEPFDRTRIDGTYTIEDVPYGLQRLRVAGQPGWAQTAGGNSIVVDEPTEAAPAIGMNFEAIVRGTVYRDDNANGVRDPGEPPLANWRVWEGRSTFERGAPNGFTDANGNYQVRYVPPLGQNQFQFTRMYAAAPYPYGSGVAAFQQESFSYVEVVPQSGRTTFNADIGFVPDAIQSQRLVNISFGPLQKYLTVGADNRPTLVDDFSMQTHWEQTETELGTTFRHVMTGQYLASIGTYEVRMVNSPVARAYWNMVRGVPQNVVTGTYLDSDTFTERVDLATVPERQDVWRFRMVMNGFD